LCSTISSPLELPRFGSAGAGEGTTDRLARNFERDGDGAHGASLSGESRDALDIATGKASRSLDRKRNGKRSCKLTHMR